MHTLNVNTPSHRYPIYIGHNLYAQAAPLLAPHLSRRVAIISNDTVAPLYLPRLQALLNSMGRSHFSIVLPDGEAHKNSVTLNLIYDGLMQQRAERRTTLLALGGGVIGDMVGFAAATYQRGAPFVQLPTTLLSQVDSSVGGKTAINHPLGKNMIGAFYQPQAVLADLDTLATLNAREFAAGMAEVIKYALLGDADFLCWLEQHIAALMRQESDVLAQAVFRCCQMKAEIVAADETEQGIRAHLNLGHTFGHAIEAEVGYGQWLHGEAVAAGMVLAARLSARLGHLSAAETERICALIRAAGLPTAPPKMSLSHWLAHMQHDKKVCDGRLRFVVLHALGRAALTEQVTTEQLACVLQPWLPENPPASLS